MWSKWLIKNYFSNTLDRSLAVIPKDFLLGNLVVNFDRYFVHNILWRRLEIHYSLSFLIHYNRRANIWIYLYLLEDLPRPHCHPNWIQNNLNVSFNRVVFLWLIVLRFYLKYYFKCVIYRREINFRLSLSISSTRTSKSFHNNLYFKFGKKAFNVIT